MRVENGNIGSAVRSRLADAPPIATCTVVDCFEGERVGPVGEEVSSKLFPDLRQPDATGSPALALPKIPRLGFWTSRRYLATFTFSLSLLDVRER